jgi:ribosome-binding protein aMBF1 (putative translation factor)
MKICFKCGKPIETEKISFREECRGCGSDVHVCLNCAFYDPARANACMEPRRSVRERSAPRDSSGSARTRRSPGKIEADALNELKKR